MRDSRDKQEKINMTPALLLEKFSGRRIILGGCNGQMRDEFVQNLTYMIEQNKSDVVLLNGVKKAQAQDYVVLFGKAAEHTELLALGQELQELAKSKPMSTVLLSDYAVYGKCFGEQKLKKESELGYVSHTSRDEIFVQNMRMAEHLVCRLAREEGVNAKVVRGCAGLYDEEAKVMILAVLQVLLCGDGGEVYNLPVSRETKNDCKEEARSPLSPMKVVPDTGKFAKLTEMK